MRVCVTGAGGFIAGYLIAELLEHRYEVVGLDNLSKYGRVMRSFETSQSYRLVQGDAKDTETLKQVLDGCDILVAGAAKIGGISYFHRYAYDLLAENERIAAATFDAAIWAHKHSRLQKIVVISSSMVFESTSMFPTPEGAQLQSPPPRSTYGFQKLACEYFAQGAFEQYGLPFTIVRPFNCVGIGEGRAEKAEVVLSGNVQLAMSHVLPDLVIKVLHGQRPLRIFGSGFQVRHYTYGGDLARGIRMSIESPAALNEDFNLSTAVGCTVIELARTVWDRLCPDSEFCYVSEPPYEHDVQRRIPDVSKAKRLLGFEATTTLDQVLDEVVPWLVTQVEQGAM